MDEHFYHLVIYYNLVVSLCMFTCMIAVKMYMRKHHARVTPGGEIWSTVLAGICLSSVLAGIERLHDNNYALTHGSLVFAAAMTYGIYGWIKFLRKKN